MTDTPFVRADVRAFLDRLAEVSVPAVYQQPVAASRQFYRDARGLADLAVGELAVMRDARFAGPGGEIEVRLFDARERRLPGPAMLFAHGGGWVLGDLDTHAGFCAELARGLDLPVVAVHYRRAPEHRWPAAADDVEAAARWLADSPDALGRAVTGLVLCGDSAGGTLAITTAMALRDRPARVPVIAQAPIYPAADSRGGYASYDRFGEGFLLTRDAMDWYAKTYAADIDDPRGSPLAGDVAGLPPAVVVTASLDPIRDQGRAYAAALVEAGVPVHFREAVGNVHGFVTLRRAIPSSAGDVAGFVKALRPVIAEAEANRVMAQAAG